MSSGKKGSKEKLVFAPGCALMLYKPELAAKIHRLLIDNFGEMDMLLTCCQHNPLLEAGSKIINICPGCDKRFRNDYSEISTISLWEILNVRNYFIFPDYKGLRMSIIDACPTRDQDRIHDSIRSLLLKMNISLIEPAKTRKNSTCCGDGSYGEIPADEVKKLMIQKASEMPVDDVVVYCVSCIKSVYNGGKNPQYLIDLLFAEETVPKTYDSDEWHKELRAYIDEH
jgi:Fe-S oxidoreductase